MIIKDAITKAAIERSITHLPEVDLEGKYLNRQSFDRLEVRPIKSILSKISDSSDEIYAKKEDVTDFGTEKMSVPTDKIKTFAKDLKEDIENAKNDGFLLIATRKSGRDIDFSDAEVAIIKKYLKFFFKNEFPADAVASDVAIEEMESLLG